jgi:hypothetical protein
MILKLQQVMPLLEQTSIHLDKLLLGKLTLAEIVKVKGVSEQ